MEPHKRSREGSLTGATVGQFQILERIGSGGMGDVYRARDSRLKRIVAVKAQSERLAADASARRRFIRETRLAARVTHAYVATVFDVVEQDDTLLLVMEYIEGQTLRERIRQGPTETGTALRFAREIAEGLQAIHRAGLVHHDLKPANVMVTSDGHAKVTDFGLARQTALPPDTATLHGAGASADTTAVEPSTAHGLAGTLPYMAPEQLRQQPADQRSDLFSFGVLLYELVTGEHPFARATTSATIEAILKEPPGGGREPETLTACPPLRDAIFRLLEKNPADRYPTAHELLADLERVAPGQDRRRPWKRRAVVLAAGVVLLAGTALGGLTWIRRPLEGTGPRVVVALAPFEDRTGDAEERFRGILAADLLAHALQPSRLVRVIGPDETERLLRGVSPDADPAVIAGRVLAGASADYVAAGRLYREMNDYVASVSFFSAGTNTALEPIQARGRTLSDVAQELAWSLRRALPTVSTLTAWRDDRTDVAEVTSQSDEARLAFERGMLALRDGKLTEAIARLERAVEVDPSFALALGQLAVALREAGYDRRAREMAERAVHLVPEHRSRATERLALTLAAIRARVLDRNADAVEATGRLVALYPDEPALIEMSARALDRAGKYDAALTEVDRALALDEVRASSHTARAGILGRMGRGAEGLVALDRAEQLYRAVGSEEGLAEVDFLRGRLLISLERYDEAETRLADAEARYRAVGGETQVAKVLLEAAKSDNVRGLTHAAGEKLERATQVALAAGNLREIYDAKSLAGMQEYQQGEFETAERLLREAVDLGHQLENDFVVYPQFNLASLLNYLGRGDEARVVLADCVVAARNLGRKDVEAGAARTLADLDYQLGRLDEAVKAYERLLAEAEPGEPAAPTARVYLRLLEIHVRRGNLGEALRFADLAVESYRRLEMTGQLGYALVGRARVHADLGRLQSARQDLDEARAIATAPDAKLDDLLAKCALAEAALRACSAEWNEMLSWARRAASATRSGPPVAQVQALAFDCQAATELGRSDAVERCRAAIAVGRAPVPDVAQAEALLAAALARAGRLAEARTTAVAAIGAAERMGLHLAVARAAAALGRASRLERPPDYNALLESGRRALARYIEGAPESDRPQVEGRVDLRELQDVFDSTH